MFDADRRWCFREGLIFPPRIGAEWTANDRALPPRASAHNFRSQLKGACSPSTIVTTPRLRATIA